MNPELRELYQSVILDHNKQPRNFGDLPEANGRAEGHNPLCGDHLSIEVRIEDETLREITFQGQGCAISTASASLMSEAVKGRPVAEVRGLFERFNAPTSSANASPVSISPGSLSYSESQQRVGRSASVVD